MSGHVVICGAGAAGTMVANRLAETLPCPWSITVVDPTTADPERPELPFVPLDRELPDKMTRAAAHLTRNRVVLIHGSVERVSTGENTVYLANGTSLPYDQLIIATGTTPRPDLTPGMQDAGWGKSIHEFSTAEGSEALRNSLRSWTGGRLVVQIDELPVKCPVAQIEFAFFADDFFRHKGIRDQVDITFVTAMPGAPDRPVACERLGAMLTQRSIALETDFRVDIRHPNGIDSDDGRHIPFDLLVTVPLHTGADFVSRSGLGNERNLIAVDPETWLTIGHDNIFAIGDAAALPTPAGGTTIQAETERFVKGFVAHVRPAVATGAAESLVDRSLKPDCAGEAQVASWRRIATLTQSRPAFGPLRLLREWRRALPPPPSLIPIGWDEIFDSNPLPLATRIGIAGGFRHGR